ncbi:MAG TPA: tetratricopeptide repeat protein, partial [Terracidiphilus sp.]|nr:tetratricopeptide repeat protein [Terracidiphilus sp.]
AHVASLLYQTGDYQQSLDEYRRSLRGDPHNAIALAGAGQAAFELGQYRLARRYLRQAVALKPSDSESAQRLRLADLALQLDPFRPRMRAADRERIVIQDFSAAGDRLKSCAAAAQTSSATETTTAIAGASKTLEQSWTQLRPKVNPRELRRDPDLVNTAMSLVFQIERAGNDSCGPGSDTEKALLLVANLHEGL